MDYPDAKLRADINMCLEFTVAHIQEVHSMSSQHYTYAVGLQAASNLPDLTATVTQRLQGDPAQTQTPAATELCRSCSLTFDPYICKEELDAVKKAPHRTGAVVAVERAIHAISTA